MTFGLLIQKEILEQLLSLRFALACTICLIISMSSAFVLTKDYKEALADYNTNVVMHDKEVDENGDVWGKGLMVDRPPNPLQIFVRGVERHLTASIRVTFQQEPELESDTDMNPVNDLFPPIDLLFFIGVVMSLLAIAFSYDAISGEKESGTLKLLMSYSLPRDQVLIAKWFGGYIALATPLLLSLLCSLVIVLLFPTVELQGDDWLAIGALVAAGLLYLAAIYSLGVFISARTQLASTSITVLLMIWVLMVLVIPNVSPYLASQIQPLPPFTEIDADKVERERDLRDEFNRELDEFRDKNPDIEEWGNDGRWGTEWNLIEQRRALKLIDAQSSIDQAFVNQLSQQLDLAKYLSRISPFSSFAYAATALSATGPTERERFLATLPEYRKEVAIFITNMWSRMHAENIDYDDRDYSGRPQYVHTLPDIEQRFADSLIDVMLLGVWCVVFFMGAYLSFLRYDVK